MPRGIPNNKTETVDPATTEEPEQPSEHPPYPGYDKMELGVVYQKGKNTIVKGANHGASSDSKQS